MRAYQRRNAERKNQHQISAPVSQSKDTNTNAQQCRSDKNVPHFNNNNEDDDALMESAQNLRICCLRCVGDGHYTFTQQVLKLWFFSMNFYESTCIFFRCIFLFNISEKKTLNMIFMYFQALVKRLFVLWNSNTKTVSKCITFRCKWVKFLLRK